MARGDSAVHRSTITEMSLDDVDALLLTMRERRLAIVRVKQEAELAKRGAYIEHLRERINKQLGMLQKELDAAEKAIEKAEARALKIRALRLEAEG